jgi:phytoene synthase
MYIVGFKSHDAVKYAIKLGVALQMTNILRDVGEDYRNGRLYLPREELIQYGIREQTLPKAA